MSSFITAEQARTIATSDAPITHILDDISFNITVACNNGELSMTYVLPTTVTEIVTGITNTLTQMGYATTVVGSTLTISW